MYYKPHLKFFKAWWRKTLPLVFGQTHTQKLGHQQTDQAWTRWGIERGRVIHFGAINRKRGQLRSWRKIKARLTKYHQILKTPTGRVRMRKIVMTMKVLQLRWMSNELVWKICLKDLISNTDFVWKVLFAVTVVFWEFFVFSGFA